MEGDRERNKDRDKRDTERERETKRQGEGLGAAWGRTLACGLLRAFCPSASPPPSPSLARNPGAVLPVASLWLASWGSWFTWVPLMVPGAPGEHGWAGSYRLGTKRILWE